MGPLRSAGRRAGLGRRIKDFWGVYTVARGQAHRQAVRLPSQNY